MVPSGSEEMGSSDGKLGCNHSNLSASQDGCGARAEKLVCFSGGTRSLPLLRRGGLVPTLPMCRSKSEQSGIQE